MSDNPVSKGVYGNDSPKITALGGGTGLSTLIRGLKGFTEEITAVVTVADDGGGSGMIRQDFGILPPGDIRNCILALANVEPIMEQLLQYRFKDGCLKGQNFGNLLIAAMADLCHGFEKAVKEISNVLAVTGRVYPVTLDNISLLARLLDGTLVEGESQIPLTQMERNSPIDQISLIPENVKPLPEVLDALATAEGIVIGPGSLYTSLIPHLLIPDINEAIRTAPAMKIYVANIMTQPGETSGFSLMDHYKVLERYGGQGLIDCIIVNNRRPPEEFLVRYKEEGSFPVVYEEEYFEELGIEIIAEDLLDYSKGYLRHHPKRLAQAIVHRITASASFSING